MKALIIDDEFKAQDILSLYIRYHIPEIAETKCASGGSEATALLDEFSPNIVFLDIIMPGMDGFEWLQSLEKRNFDVIFTTAHDEYAIRAIRFSAFDYLLKPLDTEDLRETINRYLEVQRHSRIENYQNLFSNIRNEPKHYKLTIPTTEGTHYLDPADIIRCEADGNYTHFYRSNGKHIMASRPIGHYGELLEDYNFIRCHKSHLVNKRHVTRKNEGQLTMSDGITVEVSRRRRAMVSKKLANSDKDEK